MSRHVHRYEDCPDVCRGDSIHVDDDDPRQVTCPACRESMGLPPIESDETMVKARDLKVGDVVDLEPAFRAFPEGDDARELADGVHWSIYEGATLIADPSRWVQDGHALVTLEHANGVFTLPADFELEILARESEG